MFQKCLRQSKRKYSRINSNLKCLNNEYRDQYIFILLLTLETI
jgi:hypothetical protein